MREATSLTKQGAAIVCFLINLALLITCSVEDAEDLDARREITIENGQDDDAGSPGQGLDARQEITLENSGDKAAVQAVEDVSGCYEVEKIMRGPSQVTASAVSDSFTLCFHGAEKYAIQPPFTVGCTRWKGKYIADGGTFTASCSGGYDTFFEGWVNTSVSAAGKIGGGAMEFSYCTSSSGYRQNSSNCGEGEARNTVFGKRVPAERCQVVTEYPYYVEDCSDLTGSK